MPSSKWVLLDALSSYGGCKEEMQSVDATLPCFEVMGNANHNQIIGKVCVKWLRFKCPSKLDKLSCPHMYN